MPLVIALSQGEGFLADTEEFFVTEIGKTSCIIEGPESTDLGRERYEITADKSVKLRDQVFLSLGNNNGRSKKTVSLAIDAPRSIPLTRIAQEEKEDMNNYRNPEITTEALDDALALGLGSSDQECEDYLKKACELSAPVTHDAGDFRYEDLILDIEDGALHGVSRR